MGAKISVLIGFSLIQKIVGGLSTKKYELSKQDSLALYLKKNLKSSGYMDRQDPSKPMGVAWEKGGFVMVAGEIQ